MISTCSNEEAISIEAAAKLRPRTVGAKYPRSALDEDEYSVPRSTRYPRLALAEDEYSDSSGGLYTEYTNSAVSVHGVICQFVFESEYMPEFTCEYLGLIFWVATDFLFAFQKDITR